jgi:hypothetical protein
MNGDRSKKKTHREKNINDRKREKDIFDSKNISQIGVNPI